VIKQLIIVLLLFSVSAFSQDTIVHVQQGIVNAKVKFIKNDSVYFTSLEGKNKSFSINDLVGIKYANGEIIQNTNIRRTVEKQIYLIENKKAGYSVYDAIILKSKQKLDVNFISMNNDSVFYFMPNKNNSIIKSVLIKDLAGIKFKNSSSISFDNNNIMGIYYRILNKKRDTIPKYKSKGFYVGLETFVGIIDFEYNPSFEVNDSYYLSTSDNENTSYSMDAELVVRYKFSNYFGFKIGLGYLYYHNYYSDIFYKNDSALIDSKDELKYERWSEINAYFIPINIFLMSRNRFGFYAGVGADIIIPHSAKYKQYQPVLTGNDDAVVYGDFKSEIPETIAYFSVSAGIHFTLNKRFKIILGGRIGGGEYVNMIGGFKLGVNYYLSY